MCGIVGIFDLTGGSEIDRRLLQAMTDRLAHRGPDGDGFLVAPGIGLGHRRLAIIDLAGGDQPIFNEDGTVGIVFNGEIYNFQELRRELEARGHRFKTRSDTETIVHGWEEWGEACVERFNGMFAFALWDSARETLFLARDRAGEKPLYYAALDDGTVVFGSELKALLLHPRIERRIDPLAVEDYLAYGYVPDPRTIYATVAKLPAAHTLTLVRGKPVPGPRQYWDVAFHVAPPASEDEAAAELIQLLRSSVDMRMIAEVPVGAFLSGGVDSSGVVAMMAGVSDTPVNTCSISFRESGYDESAYAAAIAARYKTRHHVKQVTADDFDLIDRLANFYDEPFADSSAMPTYRVCALARERVTVALSGDGGDEVFAGYRRYRWHHYEERVRRYVPASLRRPLFGALGQIYPKADWAPRVFRAKATLEGIARDTVEAYFHSVSLIGDGQRQALFSAAQTRALQGYRAIEVLRGHMERAPADDDLSQIQYADMKTYLPGDILTKVDRASMANSLEVRVPILDHRLMEWAGRLPLAMKLRGREGKYLFKKALQPFVGDETLYRPKMGFGVPLGRWFRGPLREKVRAALSGPVLGDTRLFEGTTLTRLVDQHQSGVRDHSAVIWALLMFESFLRNVHLAGTAPVSERERRLAVGD